MMDPSLWNTDKREWHHANSSRGYPFSMESPWLLFFFGGGGMPRGQTINWDLYVHNRGTCSSLSGELVLTKMLPKSSFDTTTHGNSQFRKHRKQSHKSEGLFFRTLHTAPILLPQISTLRWTCTGTILSVTFTELVFVYILQRLGP